MDIPLLDVLVGLVYHYTQVASFPGPAFRCLQYGTRLTHRHQKGVAKGHMSEYDQVGHIWSSNTNNAVKILFPPKYAVYQLSVTICFPVGDTCIMGNEWLLPMCKTRQCKRWHCRTEWAIPLNKDTPPIDDNLICPGGVAADFCPGVVLRIANVCPRVLYR